MKKISFLLWAILCFSTIVLLCETKTLIESSGEINLSAHPDDSHIDPCEEFTGRVKTAILLLIKYAEFLNLVKKLPDANSAEFNGTIIYEPIGNDHIRLAGDSDYYNHGLVKVFRNNSWGYVCDDDWDINDANVACRQLGFNLGAAKFLSASVYGEAKDGLYLMDDVKCAGDEMQLQKCPFSICHNCDKNEAAGVICNLNTGCEDQWIAGPTGCYRFFNTNISRYDAKNKCKSIKGHLVKIETQEENNFLSSILRMGKEMHYWLTDGIKEQNWIWKTDGKPISPSFWFPGWEPQSQFPKPSNNTFKRCLALANAFKYKDSKYLSEYFYWDDIICNNVSNFICETEKTKTPAAECYTGNGADYRGSKSVTESGIHCDKWTRSRRLNPSTHQNAGLGDHNYCRNPDGDSRPWCWVDYQKNLFSYCDIPKCSIITEITKEIVPKASTKDSLNCPKNEMPCASINRCISLSWKCDGEKDCTGGEDEANCDYKLGLFERKYPEFIIKKDPVEIYMFITLEMCARTCISQQKFDCKAFEYKPIKKYCKLYDTNEGIKSFIPNLGTYYLLKAVRIQLVGGSSETNGRIEIIRKGVKGTVCDDQFDNNDAKVICRMMGYSSGEVIPNTFGEGKGVIWLDDLSCTGSEYDLEVCPNLSWGTHDCEHNKDVAIKCFKEADTTLSSTTSIPPTSSTDQNAVRIQLIGGSLEISGRVEITHGGVKGTVCDDQFDNNDAKVICRMMGYSFGEVIPNIFRQGQGVIWLDDLSCTGSEYDLEACPNLNWGVHNCEHKEDVAIKCFKAVNTIASITPTFSTDRNATRIELVGGSLEISGRIEITRRGEKGSVCDNGFDNNEAKVICRMIGHSSGEVIPNIFGQGKGAIWLDNLNCTGSEYDIEVCPNLSWGKHNCEHDKDVALKCFKEANTTLSTSTISSTDQNSIRIQLIGGKLEMRGRIEITRKEVKGTVCDDHFDNNDAKVICRMMGYSSGKVISNIYGQGQGIIWLDDLNCTGSEVELESCSNLSWGTHNCVHNEDVAIKCIKVNPTIGMTPTFSTDQNAVRIQLVDGPSEVSGRIEITRGGTIGSVCDDEFDDNDAKVICRMMGYSTGVKISNTFGDGEGVIWLDDLGCTGSEDELEICPNLSWEKHNCKHSEDVAIKCFKKANTTLSLTTSIPPTSSTDQNAVRIQLIGGSSEINGRIEITHKGVKGTVCDDHFDNSDAKVICRMMGYSSGEVIPNIFGQGQGVIWLDDLNCTGTEVELEVCSNLSWGKHNCGHNEDVAIKCFSVVNTRGSITPTSSTDENATRIQLVGGSSEISGRIEITRGGTKGSVCDDEFDDNDAIVICRMIGHSTGEEIPNTFGDGEGVIWLDDLNCTGSEDGVEICPNLSWGKHNCGHNEDVAIKCFKNANTTLSSTTSIPPTSTTDQNYVRIQLIGGSSGISGRIEITRKGVKGTVCDDHFDNNDAKVICRMMGYSSGKVIPNIFGQGQGVIWLDDLNCTGSEVELESCSNLSWGMHNCGHSEDVAIKCIKKVNTTTSTIPTFLIDQNATRIQLVDGSSEISGRIEMTRERRKGSVCDDEFDDNDAKVICRMMGYSTGEEIPNIFGDGEGVIWLDNLNCTGSEDEIEICPNISWGKHNCRHNEDVAIKCFKNANTTLSSTTSIPPTSTTDQNYIRIQLIGGSSEINGRIEITHKGVKGTVCDDHFDNSDAKVICRMMGYSSGEVIPNIFGQGQGVIWLDDLNCTGSEVELEVCSTLSWGKHNCGHNEDVAIKCFSVVNTLGSITPTSSTDQNAIRIRLVGGSSEVSGRIEITRGGTIGSVCDGEFDDNDAKVICRMMGYSTGEEIPNIFGDGEGVIWLDNLNCTGSEDEVEICPNLSWGKHNCKHSEDVAIKCFKKAVRIKLVGGSSELSGRIEITRNGIKGTVCDDEFDDNDAKVICRMMGYSSGEVIVNIFGQGEGTIWLDNLNCSGSESELEICPNLSWGDHDCTHKEDVALNCSKEPDTTLSSTTSIPSTPSTDQNAVRIKLVGGSSELSGRIEITRNGIKGTVCDDEFDDNDAKVICRMMGYSSGEVIVNIFGQGDGTIWLDNLNCSGSESELEICPNLSWGDHDCTHKEDVALNCSKEPDTTLSSTTSIPSTPSTDQNVTCGRRPIKQRYQRISGGHFARYGAFPWQARILNASFWGKLHHCGAAIINKFWLLTAAHCLKNNLKKENTLLQTGDLNSRIWDTYEQSFQAEHLIAHPSYDSLTFDYDVGLIKLRPDRNGNGVVFNDYVQPVCLPPQNLSMSAGTRCEISGWGSTGQTYTSMLKAATVPLLSYHVCETDYKDISPRMLCAGYHEGGIDACQGDSGGPLVCSINGVHTLIGIISWGNGCAKPNYPGVYANVAYLKPWITATIAKYS